VRRIYLDNNATTQLAPEVAEAMTPYLDSRYGNASSQHTEGRLARRALEEAREQIAALLDALSDQVIFTSGGTEANNLAVFGLAADSLGRVVTSTIEHPSVLGCFSRLESRGFDVARVPVDRDAVIAGDRFEELLQSPVRLASIMLANNEVGTIQDVASLAAAARQRSTLFHTDAVQAVGRVPVSFRSLGVHALSLSAHKFHGPVGVGALVVQDKRFLAPVLAGGHQEFGVRPGTESVALAVGMARALQRAAATMADDMERVAALRETLEQRLMANLNCSANSGGRRRVPNTLNVRFADIDAQSLVMALDLAGVACSTGSACSSGAPTPSHVLRAMGLTEAESRSSIRFSLSRYTTEGDIDRAADLICRVGKNSAACTRQ
jgi:cysteine desulfurase